VVKERKKKQIEIQSANCEGCFSEVIEHSITERGKDLDIAEVSFK
jgi:hypothetical protein